MKIRSKPEKRPTTGDRSDLNRIFAVLALIVLFFPGCGGGSSSPPTDNPVNPGLPPSITSISPDSVSAGSSGFILTVNGSNFNSSSIVRWGGSSRSTEYVSSTRLNATIPASDVASGGTRTITVRNTTPTTAVSNGVTISITNPTPTITLLNPRMVTAGSEGFTLIIYGRNFMQDATVRKDDVDLSPSNYLSSTELSVYVSSMTLLNPKTINISVMNPYGSSWSNSIPFEIKSPALSVLTKVLPDATPGKEYAYFLQASGGIPDYQWYIESGSLPPGLILTNSGLIRGGLPNDVPEATYSFTVRIYDSDIGTDPADQPNTILQDLSIQSKSVVQGRNDMCSVDTATPISNGTLHASISPYGDVDVYAFQGIQGGSITVELFAQRLDFDEDPNSRDVYMDTFLEILDDGCNQLVVNDDIDLAVVTDSIISDYLLPYSGTYFIRISDLRGDGRPDFRYDLSLSGAD